MLKTYYQFEKFGGKKNWKGRKYLCRSFVKAFLVNLYTSMAGLTGTTLTVGNVSGTVSPSFFINVGGGGGGVFAHSGQSDSINELQADQNIGIVVGTGDTAVTAVDFGLVTKVAHGGTSGKLQHFGHFISDVVESNPNASFYIERIFRNDSGGTITIKEVGIYTTNTQDASAYPFCILRDVISPTIDVDNGEYLKVKYIIQVTV